MGFNFDTGDQGSYDDFINTLAPDSSFGAGISSLGSQLASNAVHDLLGDLSSAIASIDKGKNEADQITAVQTPLGQILQNVNQEMGSPTITLDRLYTLKSTVTSAGAQFQQLLNRPWRDGRAAQGAYATIFGNKQTGGTDTNHPGYLTVTVQNMNRMIAARGGDPGPGSPTNAAAGDSPSLVALAGLAAAAYTLLK